jgi:hypothetical protein
MRDWRVISHHIYHEANISANFLANKGKTQQEIFVYSLHLLIFVFICMDVWKYLYTYICMFVSVYRYILCIHKHKSMYVYICVYVYYVFKIFFY